MYLHLLQILNWIISSARPVFILTVRISVDLLSICLYRWLRPQTRWTDLTHTIINTLENRKNNIIFKVFLLIFLNLKSPLKTSNALSPSTSQWPWGYFKQCQTRRVMHSDRWLFRSGRSPLVSSITRPARVRLCYMLQVQVHYTMPPTALLSHRDIQYYSMFPTTVYKPSKFLLTL